MAHVDSKLILEHPVSSSGQVSVQKLWEGLLSIKAAITVHELKIVLIPLLCHCSITVRKASNATLFCVSSTMYVRGNNLHEFFLFNCATTTHCECSTSDFKLKRRT